MFLFLDGSSSLRLTSFGPVVLDGVVHEAKSSVLCQAIYPQDLQKYLIHLSQLYSLIQLFSFRSVSIRAVFDNILLLYTAAELM